MSNYREVKGAMGMKFVSWNVNGLRACMQKGFEQFFTDIDADLFGLQEIKLQESQIDWKPNGYESYWNYAEKKGYSGTAIFSKKKPLSVKYGIGLDLFDKEGRSITLEFEDFYFITLYTPNSQDQLARLNERMIWEDHFRSYVERLSAKKGVIFCGDLNVAHQEIDLKNPASNRKSAGFSDEEREKFTALLNAGFIDTYRYFYPDQKHAYTWWSYMFKARQNNAGWRIDYFLTSQQLKSRLLDAKIHADVLGSDHCPVSLEIQ